jgi:hypothetical protein
LAPQKIKAIKYLGTIGCGCYQKEGVREALLDSLDDCTEEVRYEAALALCRAAGTNCDKCGTTCCDAKVMNKLKALADGTDEQCCNKESSERVRDAARQALGACKNKLPATNVTPGIPTPPGTPSGIQPEPLKKKAPESTHIIPAPVERPTPAPRQPVPATIKKPVDLPADAPAGDLLPVPPPPSGASHKEVHKHVVQTAANTAPGAPVRLRLVIGGDEPNDSGAEFREVPNGGSQR